MFIKKLKNNHIAIVMMFAIFLAIYLIAAFLLKSEYPLSSHLLSGKDAYDVLKDALGLISPFVIAYVIYQIWHSQKGKEVVASEAKNLIKGLFEEAALISSLAYSIPKTQEDLIEKMDKLDVLIQNNLRSVLYIKECLHDLELQTALDNYQNRSPKMFALLRGEMRSLNRIAFAQRVRGANDDIQAYIDFIVVGIHALKPYSLYQIKFNLKL